MDTNTKTAQHLAELQRMSISYADKLQEQFFPALDVRLMEMADAAKNNEQQWRVLQLVREIKRQKAMLATVFKKHLGEGFQQFQRNELGGKDTRKEDMSGDLSLVADDVLEQNLAAASLSRRSETRFAEALYALNQRLAVLNGGKKLADDGNPMGPYQFADALQAEINLLKLDTRLTVLFFRIFEKVLLETLGELYAAANDYLIKQGVLPNLRFGIGNTAGRSKLTGEKKAAPAPEAEASPAAPNSSSELPVNPEDGTQVTQQQLYGAIRELQQQQRLAAGISQPVQQGSPSAQSSPSAQGSSLVQGSRPPAQEGGYTPGYFSQPGYASRDYASHGNAAIAACSHEEMVIALAAVPTHSYVEVLEQVAVPPSMTVQQYQSVTAQLRQQLGDDKDIHDEDSRIIDLVGMLFEYMLGDKHLPDAVKAVLSYLHTPYLKAAFVDKALFDKPEHPSRQLLNCLAEAGSRWVGGDGDSQFKVFPKIKSVVRRVLTEFRNDLSLFEELLLEMQEFGQKVERNVDLMERRARDKADGEDRLREVKRRVLHEIRARMNNHDLPSGLVVLLLQPWSDYLTFILLRHGEESAPWQEGLDAVEDMIWSIQPKADAGERNRLMLLQEPLQARVQNALETIAYDQSKSNKLLEALNQSQMLALQNLVTESVAPEKRAEIEADAVAELGEEPLPDLSDITEAEQDLVDKLRTIEFGTWMEFDELDQSRNVRAKVAWYNARTSRYMLVDRSGKQLAVKSGLDMARLILAGHARMIAGSTKPFFERALDNILARLKVSAAP
jgi:hypothetical protein